MDTMDMILLFVPPRSTTPIMAKTTFKSPRLCCLHTYIRHRALVECPDVRKMNLKSKNIELSFNYDNIKRANLVFTEEMFRALLNKKK